MAGWKEGMPNIGYFILIIDHRFYKQTSINQCSFNIPTADYLLGDVNIKSGKEEKDLGIIIHQTLKSSQQCVAAANSANKTFGMINRTFVNKDCITMLRLYQSLVRPKLEYCVQAWRPVLGKADPGTFFQCKNIEDVTGGKRNH